jgi:predicted RNase H-like HicB family nuclease
VAKEMNTFRYSINIKNEGKFFIINFPEHPQLFTQATHPREIEAMAKDLIYLRLGTPIELIELEVTFLQDSLAAQ